MLPCVGVSPSRSLVMVLRSDIKVSHYRRALELPVDNMQRRDRGTLGQVGLNAMDVLRAVLTLVSRHRDGSGTELAFLSSSVYRARRPARLPLLRLGLYCPALLAHRSKGEGVCQ